MNYLTFYLVEIKTHVHCVTALFHRLKQLPEVESHPVQVNSNAKANIGTDLPLHNKNLTNSFYTLSQWEWMYTVGIFSVFF